MSVIESEENVKLDVGDFSLSECVTHSCKKTLSSEIYGKRGTSRETVRSTHTVLHSNSQLEFEPVLKTSSDLLWCQVAAPGVSAFPLREWEATSGVQPMYFRRININFVSAINKGTL